MSFRVVFEGADGSGKSVRVKILTDFLQSLGIKVRHTVEPTKGLYGTMLRTVEMSKRDRLWRFILDRYEHENALLLNPPKDTIIVQDRSWLSTWVYQIALNSGVVANAKMVGTNCFNPEFAESWCDVFLELFVQPQLWVYVQAPNGTRRDRISRRAKRSAEDRSCGTQDALSFLEHEERQNALASAYGYVCQYLRRRCRLVCDVYAGNTSEEMFRATFLEMMAGLDAALELYGCSSLPKDYQDQFQSFDLSGYLTFEPESESCCRP